MTKAGLKKNWNLNGKAKNHFSFYQIFVCLSSKLMITTNLITWISKICHSPLKLLREYATSFSIRVVKKHTFLKLILVLITTSGLRSLKKWKKNIKKTEGSMLDLRLTKSSDLVSNNLELIPASDSTAREKFWSPKNDNRTLRDQAQKTW